MKTKEDSLTVSVILYKSKVLSNGEHPLMLRVTKNRQRKYVSLGLSCSEKLWNKKKNSPSSKHPKKDEIDSIISKLIQQYRDAKIDARKDDKRISASGLVEMVENPVASRSVLQFFKEVYERMHNSGQIGNAKAYRFVYSSFKKFASAQKRDYTFAELDFSVLLKYENALRARGVGENSLSIHFRTLRSLYNMAIHERIAQKKDYPFSAFKISKFNLQANRRAITKDEIRKIESLKLEEGSELYESRQIFLFIYYGHGINFVDIAKLKWSDKEQGRIHYTRSKTGRNLHFALSDPLQEILNYWFPVTGADSKNYIFPILDRKRHQTPYQIDNRIHKKITETNKLLKELGGLAGIAVPLTTYVARHSFATVLYHGDVAPAIISEAMGHQTESITRTYLKSFDNSVIDDAVKKNL